ncbi:MAG: apolipoprotein N-acyltransferase [Nitrosomonas sp.]|nr:apolipoprotein N-acyltransferase [Nitrosomonas sp.]
MVGISDNPHKKSLRTDLKHILKPLSACLLGILTVPGFAPFYFYPLPLLTLMLLGILLRKSVNPLQAALISFSFAMGLFGVGVSWLYISLHDFGSMPMPLAIIALILLCIYLSLFPGLAAGIASFTALRKPLIWPWMIAALWTLSEWLRGVLFTGFPWLAVGYSQAPAGPLAGFASMVGVYGVSFLLVLTASGFACWQEQWRNWKFGVLLIAVWLAGWGLQQISWVTPSGEPVRVSLLQGNISQDLKWRSDHTLTSLQTYTELIQASSSQLIITPEISFPLFREELPALYWSILGDHARSNQGDVLIGMAERRNTNGEYYNTMFSLGSSPEQAYRKHHLVPFGEYIPLKQVFGRIIEVLKIPLSDFSRGSKDQRPMQLAGKQVAINICYEDVFGEEIISQLPEAELLVNVSNDAWFGRSIGPWQHLQISQMRAQETGRYMLRATNTGVTAIINERGRVLQTLEMFATDGLHGWVQGFSGATPYVLYGNKPILGLIGLLLLAGSIIIVFSASRKTL